MRILYSNLALGPDLLFVTCGTVSYFSEPQLLCEVGKIAALPSESWFHHCLLGTRNLAICQAQYPMLRIQWWRRHHSGGERGVPACLQVLKTLKNKVVCPEGEVWTRELRWAELTGKALC